MAKLLRRGAKLVRRNGKFVRVTDGEPCECCGGETVCNCGPSSPWYAVGCSGTPYLKFQATFTPDTNPVFPTPLYDEPIGYTNQCVIIPRPFGGIEGVRINANATFSTGEFVMTPANSGQSANCQFSSIYEIHNGQPPYDGHGLSDGGLPRESSSTLQSPASASAGGGWSSTYANLGWFFELQDGLIRVRAGWNVLAIQNELMNGPPWPGLAVDQYWVARSEAWTLLDAVSEWMTPEAFCAATTVTCTSDRGGSMVLTNDAPIPPPVAGTPSAECYNVQWLDIAQTDSQNVCNYSNTVRSDILSRVIDNDGTPYYVGSESRLQHSPGEGWRLVFQTLVGDDDETTYNIPFATGGSSPHTTGGVTYTGGAGVVTITPTTGCNGATSPCDSYTDCYQLGTDDTIVVSRPGRLILILNDNNFADNENVQLEGELIVNGVNEGFTFIPNDNAAGQYVRNVAAGDTVRFVQTGGFFNIFTDPSGRMDADGQYTGGGSPGTTPAADDFPCPGLLTYTLVAKVVAP